MIIEDLISLIFLYEIYLNNIYSFPYRYFAYTKDSAYIKVFMKKLIKNYGLYRAIKPRTGEGRDVFVSITCHYSETACMDSPSVSPL